MKTSLEHDSRPAWETHVLGEPVVLYMCEDGVAMLQAGKTVQCCAWCDPEKVMTKKLEAAGYVVSHGICEPCKSRLLNSDVQAEKASAGVGLVDKTP